MSPSNPPQRTAEERERARAERERRRGIALPVAPPLGAVEPQDRVVAPPGEAESQERAAPPPVAAEPSAQVVPPLGEVGSQDQAASPSGEVGSQERVASPSGEAEPQARVAPPSGEVAPPAARPIVASLPRALPPRPSLPPRRAARARRSVRVRVAALAILALVVLGAVAAFVSTRSKSQPKPVAPIAVVRVAIPEGETRIQIARIAAAKGLSGSYLAAARRSPLLHPTHYGAPHGTPDLEGFLFPATYELYAGQPARRLVAEQLAAFHENFGTAELRRAHALHITPYQLLIVASMVEREALLAHDRPLVAAVIYNRLHLGMPLGIDSTIRYALKDFSKPLTDAQLKLDSPYNTRTHPGLPPTPISNPGTASIAAAAHPAHVGYLYYVNGADGCGELVFADSFAQFELDAAAYRQALAKHGGRVPTCRRH